MPWIVPFKGRHSSGACHQNFLIGDRDIFLYITVGYSFDDSESLTSMI